MDPYQKKLSEMKGYVPFLDKMISKLEKVKDGTKDQQLSKMKDLLKVSINTYTFLKLHLKVIHNGAVPTSDTHIYLILFFADSN